MTKERDPRPIVKLTGGRLSPVSAWDAEFLPTLDGSSYFPTGFRSSDLSVPEMSDLQTFIEASCAERGVDIWGDDGR
jgi:hypothetical protein